MLENDTKKRKWTKEHWWLIISLISLICLSLLIVIILVATKVVNWNWITGFLLGTTFSSIALLLMKKSVSGMVRTENYYYYVFLFVLRIGLYFIPFLLAVYIPNEIFGIFGVLIGFVPLVVMPFMRTIPELHPKKHEHKNLHSK